MRNVEYGVWNKELNFLFKNSTFSTLRSPLFITGTDTGVGKSVFTACIALSILNTGKKVAVIKPIQSGKPKDSDYLSELCNNKIPVFNFYSLNLPAAPLIASRSENTEINTERIVGEIRKLEKQYDSLIIEGVGGIAVPIKEKVETPHSPLYLVSDLIKELNYPLIIVARPDLGTINHTVLTIEFAKQKKLNILGFVISGYDEQTNDTVIKTAPDMISEITGIKCLIKLPKLFLNPL